jgi:hypothetical protein
MNKSPSYQKDQVFSFPYPFLRSKSEEMDDDGCWHEYPGWRPGAEYELVPPDDYRMVCDGIGSQIVTVVGTAQFPGWPTRVFYTRRWRDPEGKEFGKRRLRVTTQASFTTLIQGYRYQPERRDSTFVVGKTESASSVILGVVIGVGK